MSRQPVNRMREGCSVGVFVGIFVFTLLVAMADEAPDFAGLFIVPFFMVFFSGIGVLVWSLIPTKREKTRLAEKGLQNKPLKDCCSAIGISLLILLGVLCIFQLLSRF